MHKISCTKQRQNAIKRYGTQNLREKKNWSQICKILPKKGEFDKKISKIKNWNSKLYSHALNEKKISWKNKEFLYKYKNYVEAVWVLAIKSVHEILCK